MGKTFVGGISTVPDVTLLMEHFPVVAGSVVSYADIAALIKRGVREPRFNTVTGAWTKHIFKSKALQSIRRDGVFHFLTADDALALGEKHLHRIGRASGKLRMRAGVIEPRELSSDEKRRKHLLLLREVGALLDSARHAAKEIAAPESKTANPLRSSNSEAAQKHKGAAFGHGDATIPTGKPTP